MDDLDFLKLVGIQVRLEESLAGMTREERDAELRKLYRESGIVRAFVDTFCDALVAGVLDANKNTGKPAGKR